MGQEKNSPWLAVDLENFTVQFPEHKRKGIADRLAAAAFTGSITRNNLEKLMGSLRHAVFGTLGLDGLFSCLQCLLYKNKRVLRLRPECLHQLRLKQRRFSQAKHIPTHLFELVRQEAAHVSSVDAAKNGAGVVWIPLEGDALVWRWRFPDAVQAEMVSFSNPKGTVTNSDLELVSTVAHDQILGQCRNIARDTTLTFLDNTPAISWREKGSTSCTAAKAKIQEIASDV